MSLSRSTSRTAPSHHEDEANCVPCSLVKASSTLRKRLVVCCDGTFCAADEGKMNNPTNISRLCRVIANTGLDEEGKYIPQLVNYMSGVASGALTMANKALQGGFGVGLAEKVCEGYAYIVNNYGPGDEIFIFGFSRGAYTARSIASFICNVGLLSPGMMDYFYEIFKAYKQRDRKTEPRFKDMAWAQRYVKPGELGLESWSKERITRYDWIRRWAHYHVKVRVVGVYDTVGSVGISGYQSQPGEDIGWHSSGLSPKIEYAFQALALDESRGNFAPTLFYLDDACRRAGVKLRQCWFPGYHSCVGGESAFESDTNSVDEITFAWMIDQLTMFKLLQINRRALKYPILDRLDSPLINDSHTPKPRNPQEANERRIDWSDGTLQETNTLFYHVASKVATQRWEYIRQPGEYRAYQTHHGKKYEVDSSAFRETIHPSVWHRIQNRKYEPLALPLDRWRRVACSDGPGFEWIKSSKSGKDQVFIPEYVIPAIPIGEDVGMEFWMGCLEQVIAPGDYLRKLDGQNGITRGAKAKSARPVPVERFDSGYGDDETDYLKVEELTVREKRSGSRVREQGSAVGYYESRR